MKPYTPRRKKITYKKFRMELLEERARQYNEENKRLQLPFRMRVRLKQLELFGPQKMSELEFDNSKFKKDENTK